MTWFAEWWQTLELSSQILYCIAIPSTLVLLIQTVMIFIGFGHGGAGVNPSDVSGIDFGGDVGGTDMGGVGDLPDADPSTIGTGDGSNPGDFGTFSFFTVQGVVAFFCIFGWSGICLVSAMALPLALLISFILGLAAMFGVAKVIQLSSRLQQNGAVNVRNLIGETGTVYLNIPAEGKNGGKVTIQTSERFLEFDAISEGESIDNNTKIRVVDVVGGSVLVVERI